MHEYNEHYFRVSHPTSVELYKLSNHTYIPQMQKNILVYVFAGLVGICISIKFMQFLLNICCKTCEPRDSNNMLITNVVEVHEDSNEASELYEPPEELHQSQRNNQNIEPINQDNRNSENSENSDDLPSYYDVCVKTDKYE